jgi:RTX calcium-binding nonapeptide repeat (4 copies)
MINLTWQELGIIEVTNLFLYGQMDTPQNLADGAILQHVPAAVTITNVASFMTDGAGRFAAAQAAREPIIEQFMNGTIMPDTGGDQTMTLAQLLNTYGSTEIKSIFDLIQPAYGIGEADFDERSYVYGHSHFKIADTAVFVVKADGTRYIENYALVPAQDNFDFVTDPNLAQQILDTHLLGNKIDPSGIGQTVQINFDQSSLAAYAASKNGTTYTSDNFNIDHINDAHFILNLEQGGSLFINNTFLYASELFDAGVTKYLDNENRPILYGSNINDSLHDTVKEDFIHGTVTRTGVDISSSLLTGYPLAGWIQNGIRYIGGAGNDRLIGTEYNDVLIGGKDNDTLEGGAGDDTYIYNSGDGFDAIVDSDGTIKYDGTPLSGGKQYGDDRVHRDDNKHLYVDIGYGLVVDGNILIKNYADGNLNINLTGPEADPAIKIDPEPDLPADPQTTFNIIGDLGPLDTNPSADGV